MGEAMQEKRKDYPEIMQKLNYVCDKVDRIDKDFRGNGEPGIKERLRTVESFVVDLRKFHQDIRRVIFGSTGTIVSAIIIAIVVYVIIPK